MRILLTILSITFFTLLSTSCENKEKAARAAAELKEEERKEVLRRHQREAQEHAEQEQRKLEKLEREKQLAAKIKQLEEDRLSAIAKREAEAARLKAERKERARLNACQEFVGTQFDTLSLRNGKEYTKVTVIKADAIGITITHSTGARSIDYPFLPITMQRQCKYDAEAAKRQKNNESLATQQLQTKQHKPTSRSHSKPRTKHSEASATAPKRSQPTPATKARGSIRVRVTAQNNGRKRLELTIFSTVNSRLKSGRTNSHVRSIKANTKTVIRTHSDYSGRYSFRLVAADGSTLATASYLKKSGLQGAHLN